MIHSRQTQFHKASWSYDDDGGGCELKMGDICVTAFEIVMYV